MNAKQKAFALEYANDHNATKAAERAGYKNARRQGSRLLTKADVAAEVRRLADKAETAAIVSREEACEILSSIARAAVVDYETHDGLIDIALGDRHAVQEVTQVACDKEGNPIVKFKLASKIQALDRLAKMLGWDAPTKLEHSGDVDLTIVPPPPPADDDA